MTPASSPGKVFASIVVWLGGSLSERNPAQAYALLSGQLATVPLPIKETIMVEAESLQDRHHAALLWAITGLGGLIHGLIQLCSYVTTFINSHGAQPAVMFDTGAMWVFGIIYAMWILPASIAAVSRRRLGDWFILIIGSLLVVTNALGGVWDGVRDGGYIVVTALVGIALPGFFALKASWRLVRRRG